MSVNFDGEKCRLTIDFERLDGIHSFDYSVVESRVGMLLVELGKGVPVLITSTKMELLEE